MQFRFADKTLERIYKDSKFKAGYSSAIVDAFLDRMQSIRKATNQNDLRAIKSFHFEKLKGQRKDEYSIRLNRQFGLIFEIERIRVDSTEPGKPPIVLSRLVLKSIDDYH